MAAITKEDHPNQVMGTHRSMAINSLATEMVMGHLNNAMIIMHINDMKPSDINASKDKAFKLVSEVRRGSHSAEQNILDVFERLQPDAGASGRIKDKLRVGNNANTTSISGGT